jgi:membrane dipeptidase
MQAVFDGHNDVLFRLWQNAAKGADPVAEFIEGTRQGHIDMPRAAKGGLVGGLCAIYITSASMPDEQRDENGHYAIPLCKPLERAPSLDIALDMASIAFRIERAGGWKICRTGADIDAARAEGKFAAVLHMEGCEAIDADLAALDVFYAAGLRSLGPVWSRNTVFGHGVPFAFPSSPDTGPGLTEAGKRLVKECNRIGIAIDLCAHHRERLLGRGQSPTGRWCRATPTRMRWYADQRATSPTSSSHAMRESNGLVGAQLRRHHAAAGRPLKMRRTCRSTTWCGISTISSACSASMAWRSARTSTAPPCRPRSATPPGCGSSSPHSAARATPCTTTWRQDLPRQLAANIALGLARNGSLTTNNRQLGELKNDAW